MFCTSLRKRPEWSSVPSTLLSQKQPRWQEQTLTTHDLAMPLPQSHQQDPKEFFRIILLSPEDMQTLSATMERIERLYHQNGGRHVGIIFLINGNTAGEKGLRSFMELQAGLLSTFEIPIMPLHSVSGLQSTLFAFQRQLVQAQKNPPSQRLDPLNSLLPFCSVQPPIPEHARNILSDICPNIPALAQAASTQDGQEGLRKWLSDEPRVVQDILGFWEQEYIID